MGENVVDGQLGTSTLAQQDHIRDFSETGNFNEPGSHHELSIRHEKGQRPHGLLMVRFCLDVDIHVQVIDTNIMCNVDYDRVSRCKSNQICYWTADTSNR